MKDFTIFILGNSISDLSKLQFREFKIINIQSEEFRSFCKSTFTREEEFLERIIDDFQYDHVQRYAIIKKTKEKFGPRKIDDIYNFLLILFPSTLTVEYILDYNFDSGNLRYSSSFHNDQKEIGNREEQLEFDEDEIENINKFIEAYAEIYQSLNYLKSSIIHYINAFDSNRSHLCFIAFCICLESITNGNSEINYRIARNVAVICGKDEESSKIIFKNIKKIYDLRSKIVHGSDFSDEIVGFQYSIWVFFHFSYLCN